MSKLIMQSEKDYLDHFGEFIVRWTDEIFDLTVGKREKEDSWIWHGGFKITSVGCTMVDRTFPYELSKDNKTSIYMLIYIGFQNLSSGAPTIAQISTKFFTGDLQKTLVTVNSLITGCFIQFLNEEPILD